MNTKLLSIALSALLLTGCAGTSQDNTQASVSTYEMHMTNDMLAQQPASWGFVGLIVEIDSEQTYKTTIGNNFEVNYVPVLIEITEGANSIGEQIWYQLNAGRAASRAQHVVEDDGVISNVRAGDKLDLTLEDYRKVLGL